MEKILSENVIETPDAEKKPKRAKKASAIVEEESFSPETPDPVDNATEVSPLEQSVMVDEIDDESEGAGVLAEEAEREDSRATREAVNSSLKRGKRSTRMSQTELLRLDKGILTYDGKLSMETEQSRYNDTLVELKASEKGGLVLTGTISGKMQTINMQPCAKVFYGNWTVLIPADKLIPPDFMPENRGIKEAHMNYLGLIIAQREGSEIQFVVEKGGIDEENLLVAATRLRAMQQVRAAYYWGRNRNTGNYYINEGDIIEAKVMYVLPHGVGVEIFGVECFIESRNCSYNRINPEDYFAAGDRVLVRITRLNRSTARRADGRTVRILDVTASIREAHPNPKAAFFDQFDINEIYRAEVTYVDKNGIFVLLADKAEAKILFPRGVANVPRPGDLLSVRVIGKDPETLFITCEIVRRLPRKKLIW